MKNKGFFIFAVIIVLTASGFLYFAASSAKEEKKLEKARTEMVENLVVNYGITDVKVINAMLKVKRHLFVPESMRDRAYSEYPVSIGDGQVLLPPYTIAMMVELLGLKGNEKVLEIGTGSGYQSAIMAEIAKEVYSIEIRKYLADNAAKNLKNAGYNNVFLKLGNGWLGWPHYAPYDAMILSCAPDEMPKALIEELAEGGRMVLPFGKMPSQELKVIRKVNGKLTEETVTPIIFTPMIEKIQK